MKKIKYTIVIALSSMLVISCGGKKDGSANATANDSSENVKAELKSDSEEKQSSSNSSVDLSTPSKAVESFFQSGQSQSAENLSKCFSKNSAGEFKRIVNQQLKEKDLNDLKEMTSNAKVIGETIEGGKAVVKVKFGERDEEIRMEIVDGNWLIVDF